MAPGRGTTQIRVDAGQWNLVTWACVGGVGFSGALLEAFMPVSGRT